MRLPWLRAAWDRYFFTPVGPCDLGFGRAAFYTVSLLYYLPQDFTEWGTVSREFWMPITLFHVLGLPALGPGAIEIIETSWKVSLGLAAVGLWSRWSVLGSFLGGTYLLGLPNNFGKTSHFDALTVIIFGILVVSRCGDAWSIDAWRQRARTGTGAASLRPNSPEYRWPIRAIWVISVFVFFAAGVSKLRHSGLAWVFSDYLAILLIRHQYYVSDADPVTSWGPLIAGYPWVTRSMAGLTLLTEVLYPLALFSARARLILIPTGMGLLVGIRMLMGPTFESFLICDVFWVPWTLVGERLRARAPRRMAAAAHPRST